MSVTPEGCFSLSSNGLQRLRFHSMTVFNCEFTAVKNGLKLPLRIQ